MAKQTTDEEIILDFQIDQGDLLKQLTAAKKAILQTRKAQKDLNEEYKRGEKSIDEYAEESAKLDKQLKNEQKTYTRLNQAVNTVSNSLAAQRQRLSELKRTRDQIDRSSKKGVQEFNKLNKSIRELNESIKDAEAAGGDFQRNVGNYPEQLKSFANSVNVAGIGLGDLVGKIAGAAGPVSAIVGAVGALGAVYANSVSGARDLAFAQSRLNFIFDTTSEGLARLVGGGGGGKGLMSRFVDLSFTAVKSSQEFQIANVASFGLLGKAIDKLEADSEKAAKAVERLRELEISRAFAAGFSKEDERRAEIERRIRDDEEQSLQRRLEATDKINEGLEASRQRTVTVIRAQIQGLKESTVNLEDNREVQLQIAQLESEILDVNEDITGKLTENVTARQEILRLVKEQAEFERLDALNAGAPNISATFRQANPASGIKDDTRDVRPEGSEIVDQNRVDTELLISQQEYLSKARQKIRQDEYDSDLRAKRQGEEAKRLEEQTTLQLTANLAAQGAAIAEEGSALQQGLAFTQTLINTYLAATAALAPPPIGAGPVVGPFLAAATTAIGLANAAKIAGFETGGYTGDGPTNQVAGVVHRKEVVWNAQDVAAVGGPTAANLLRPTARSRNSRGGGYQDGGIVADQATAQVDREIESQNLLKSLPPIEVSVKEITKAQARVTVKENLAKA